MKDETKVYPLIADHADRNHIVAAVIIQLERDCGRALTDAEKEVTQTVVVTRVICVCFIRSSPVAPLVLQVAKINKVNHTTKHESNAAFEDAMRKLEQAVRRSNDDDEPAVDSLALQDRLCNRLRELPAFKNYKQVHPSKSKVTSAKNELQKKRRAVSLVSSRAGVVRVDRALLLASGTAVAGGRNAHLVAERANRVRRARGEALQDERLSRVSCWIRSCLDGSTERCVFVRSVPILSS